MDLIFAKEFLMVIDFHQLALQLLECLANAIHDRDPQNPNFHFTVNERKAAERWLSDNILSLKGKEI